MRQANKKKGKDKVAATIMLCFCLIALTSIFTIKASIDKVSKSAGELPVTQETPTAQPEEKDATEKADTSPDSSFNASSDEDAAPSSTHIPTVDSEENETTDTDYLSPMSMENASIVKEYSMNMVIYNKTLDQYMTHPGIDIEGPAKSGVNAIADGTITDIYQDDAYGITIEITHGNGIVSKYSNLETDSQVEKGDVVTRGQQISTIGQTALYESMDKCHLHFEMYQNGKLCNPADFIDF